MAQDPGNLLSAPELTPLQQEVLEEYERLAENMKKVQTFPSSHADTHIHRYTHTHTPLPEFPKPFSLIKSTLADLVLASNYASSPRHSTTSLRILVPRSSTGCATWNERQVWHSHCSRPACTASSCSRRLIGEAEAVEAETMAVTMTRAVTTNKNNWSEAEEGLSTCSLLWDARILASGEGGRLL